MERVWPQDSTLSNVPLSVYVDSASWRYTAWFTHLGDTEKQMSQFGWSEPDQTFIQNLAKIWRLNLWTCVKLSTRASSILFHLLPLAQNFRNFTSWWRKNSKIQIICHKTFMDRSNPNQRKNLKRKLLLWNLKPRFAGMWNSDNEW